jgi:glutaredoxin 3
MVQVDIYTTGLCPYCFRAKKLLKKRGIPFNEIDVTSDPEMRRKMAERAHGRNTVPQIFIDGRHVGGSDELFELDFDGELDKLLGRED